MSITDTDWMLLQKRLEAIERSLKVFEAYVDANLKQKYYGEGSPYALSVGSLSDSGLKQEWGNKDETN